MVPANKIPEIKDTRNNGMIDVATNISASDILEHDSDSDHSDHFSTCRTDKYYEYTQTQEGELVE